MDHSTGEVIGSSRFYEWDPNTREVAIGYTFITRQYWGGTANVEVNGALEDYVYFTITATGWRDDQKKRQETS